MGLLRNASGLIIPSAAIGGSGRADDPEFHIRRLEHFGKGMGIDLASAHPQFSRKELGSYRGHDDEDLQFSSHDEGLQLSRGHMDAAREAVYDNTSGGMQELRSGALDEIEHRSPYGHHVVAEPLQDRDPNQFYGVIIKGDSGRNRNARGWGHREASEDTHADAWKGVSSNFQEFNRNRTGTPANIANLVNKVINNPNERYMGAMRTQYPNRFGSQFLGVSYKDKDDWNNEIYDQIDLKTGNWAKIDPESYFPN